MDEQVSIREAYYLELLEAKKQLDNVQISEPFAALGKAVENMRAGESLHLAETSFMQRDKWRFQFTTEDEQFHRFCPEPIVIETESPQAALAQGREAVAAVWAKWRESERQKREGCEITIGAIGL